MVLICKDWTFIGGSIGRLIIALRRFSGHYFRRCVQLLPIWMGAEQSRLQRDSICLWVMLHSHFLGSVQLRWTLRRALTQLGWVSTLTTLDPSPPPQPLLPPSGPSLFDAKKMEWSGHAVHSSVWKLNLVAKWQAVKTSTFVYMLTACDIKGELSSVAPEICWYILTDTTTFWQHCFFSGSSVTDSWAQSCAVMPMQSKHEEKCQVINSSSSVTS